MTGDARKSEAELARIQAERRENFGKRPGEVTVTIGLHSKPDQGAPAEEPKIINHRGWEREAPRRAPHTVTVPVTGDQL